MLYGISRSERLVSPTSVYRRRLRDPETPPSRPANSGLGTECSFVRSMGRLSESLHTTSRRVFRRLDWPQEPLLCACQHFIAASPARLPGWIPARSSIGHGNRVHILRFRHTHSSPVSGILQSTSGLPPSWHFVCLPADVMICPAGGCACPKQARWQYDIRMPGHNSNIWYSFGEPRRVAEPSGIFCRDSVWSRRGRNPIFTTSKCAGLKSMIANPSTQRQNTSTTVSLYGQE
ncbi:unnamed protein product [Protopolystoma xenopodis]|uniref:Uncharacterized protein n=1 Tax=Protopolystoma xenopodis TaxID=117903 RepID=A0A3S4ZPB3_9PLAT|nr:unnamed protein product [Protopolystoma xenopodis]